MKLIKKEVSELINSLLSSENKRIQTKMFQCNSQKLNKLQLYNKNFQILHQLQE